MTMLNGRLTLHNLEDAEALCQSIINRHPPSLELQQHEREDLLAWLVETAWELSLGYDPAENPNGHHHPAGGFAGYAAHILRLRTVDWHRHKLSRTHYRSGVEWKRAPQVESFDNPDQPERPIPGGHLDPAEHRDPDLLRALTSPSRRPAWLTDQADQTSPRRAAA